MKVGFRLVLLQVMLILSGCSDSIKIDPDNPSVEKFVELLGSDKFNNGKIPAFKPSDIPPLLQYRNDTTLITHFPRNPISSYAVQQTRVGIFILWTIESVRAASINSDQLIPGKFPSLNPILAKQISGDWQWVLDVKSQWEAGNRYYEWYYSGPEYARIKFIDPLEHSGYAWR